MFKNLLIGLDEFLVPLVKESLVIKKASYIDKSSILEVTIENKTNSVFTLANRSNYTFANEHDVISIKPGENNILEVRTKEKPSAVSLTFEVLDAVNAPNKHPSVTWQRKIE